MVVKEATRRSMRANRSSNTSLEVFFRKALWAAGFRGYRKNVRKLPGSPDLVFPKKKLAVFLHGCFWHRCPKCHKDAQFKTNEEFWRAKLAENVNRDTANQHALLDLGFQILVIWECEVKGDLGSTVARVAQVLGTKENAPASTH